MKLVAIELGRLTTLFHITRAAGQLYLPRAAAALVGRYNFAGSPASYEELIGDKIEFKHGEFEGTAIESLEIYNDGIIITSRSDTDFIDKFFADLSQWMADDLGLSTIKTHSINQMHDSNLIIQTDKDILKPLESVMEVAEFIGKELQKTSGLEVAFQPFGWAFATDHTQSPSLKPSAFRIERRLGTEFSLQQFVTSAPLKTKQHIAALKMLESLV